MLRSAKETLDTHVHTQDIYALMSTFTRARAALTGWQGMNALFKRHDLAHTQQVGSCNRRAWFGACPSLMLASLEGEVHPHVEPLLSPLLYPFRNPRLSAQPFSTPHGPTYNEHRENAVFAPIWKKPPRGPLGHRPDVGGMGGGAQSR